MTHKGWCTPLIIYMILAGISLLYMFIKSNEQQDLSGFILSLTWVMVWGLIMYTLCKNGHEFWSWVILFLPLILWMIVLLLAILGLIVYNI